jgi:hypothetical protein
MRISSKIGRRPEDLSNLKFLPMRGITKRVLKKFEKLTSKEKPTQVMINAEFDYSDKKGMCLIIFGRWGTSWKSFARNEIAKEDMGAIGRAYYAGIGDDGKKMIQIDLAKGKAKNKDTKIMRTLKKLIPLTLYKINFGQMDEIALTNLEAQADAEPDEIDLEDENEADDVADDGFVEVEKGQDVSKLLENNLRQLAGLFAPFKKQIHDKEEFDTVEVENLIDFCEQCLEMFNEADKPVQKVFEAKMKQVQQIKDYCSAALKEKK